MKCVYVLRSGAAPDQVYVGVTGDLRRRLAEHNAGKGRHTRRFLPWTCVVALEFAQDGKAEAFERYLKTGSGRAFLKRHFL